MAKVTIFDIRWHRAILELRFRSDEPQRLYLYRVNEERFVPFAVEDHGDYQTATLNTMTAKGREPLSDGRWIICRRIDPACLKDLRTLLEAKPYLRSRMERDVLRNHRELFEDEEFLERHGIDPQRLMKRFVSRDGLGYVAMHPYDTHDIFYAPQILNDPDGCSRFFRYANGTYTYTVWFAARLTSERQLALDLNVRFYRHNRWPRIRFRSLRFWEKQVFNIVFRVFSLIRPRRGDRILFYKQNGDGPTENMEAVQKRLIERGLDRRYRISYRYRNIFGVRQNVISWLIDLFLIAGADYIFIDDYTPVFNFIDLDEDVVLTQLWHAGVGFKSVGYARFGLAGSPDPYDSAHRHYTWALVGNEHLRDIYAEVFGIEKEALLATGMPRLDHFLEEATAQAAREDLYARYPRLKEGRVILFAPTFRGTGQRTAYYPYELLDVAAIYRMCEETDSCFIYEMHHFIQEPPQIPEQYADRVLDLSAENLNELYHVADVLITDYSSCFYDYLLLKKPVILYVPDKQSYIARRGVQRPIDELAPGEICETFDELMDTLRTRHYEEVPPKALTIDRAAERSGLASDRVIDTILLGKDVPGVRMKSVQASSDRRKAQKPHCG